MEEDRSLLHTALELDNYEECKFLLEAGLDPDELDENCICPLVKSIWNGHLPMVELLLEHGASTELVVSSYNHPLHEATRYGHLQIVELLLKKGANVDSSSSLDYRAIHCAAEEGHADIIDCLLDNGAEVNVTTVGDCTPLIIASKGGRNAAVESLLKRKANVNTADEFRNTPLYYAIIDGNEEVVRLLIEHGAKIIARTRSRITCLDLCAIGGHRGIFQLLLKAGAKFHVQDESNQFSPLHVAAENGNLDIVEYLLNIENIVDLKTSNGYTLLHSACNNGHWLLVDFLIEKGADVNSKLYSKGLTPLHLSSRMGSMEIMELLIQAGAYLEQRDYRDRTPLNLVISGFYEDPIFEDDMLRSAKLLVKYLWIKKENIQFSFSSYFSEETPCKEELLEFWCKCETQIEKMKKCIIQNTTVSVYTFLKATFDETELVKYLYNKNIVKGLKYVKFCLGNLPIYDNLNNMITYKVKIGMRRQRLLEAALHDVNIKLPVEAKRKIFSYLSISDLDNFVKSFS